MQIGIVVPEKWLVDLLILRRDPRHLLQTQPNEINALPNEQNLLGQIVGEISWQHGVLEHTGFSTTKNS